MKLDKENSGKKSVYFKHIQSIVAVKVNVSDKLASTRTTLTIELFLFDF